jgi:hypothetical protein
MFACGFVPITVARPLRPLTEFLSPGYLIIASFFSRQLYYTPVYDVVNTRIFRGGVHLKIVIGKTASGRICGTNRNNWDSGGDFPYRPVLGIIRIYISRFREE